MCESLGGRPGFPVSNSPYGTVSVAVKQHWTMSILRAQELCESRGGRPGPSQIVRRVSVEYTI